MRILVAETNIFSTIGGGQRFFSDLIRAHPDIEFHYFASGEVDHAAIPANAFPVPMTDVYRRNIEQFSPGVPGEQAATIVDSKSYDICYLLDMAASVASLSFDVLDIPDYLPCAVFLHACMQFHHVGIGKVSLSMHGVLSGALLDNWDGRLSGHEILQEFEDLLYRYADIRYGISRRYTGAWSERLRLPALLVDPQPARRAGRRPWPNAAGQTAATPPPDLCFVGRQEKFKGPDLFVVLCSQLPREAYGRIRLVGPAVSIDGHDSADILNTLAAHRKLTLTRHSVAPGEMQRWLGTERMVLVAPSRYDTFNLVVLEALLAGCPAVVSTACGVCDYLDEVYPGLPFVRIDPQDMLAQYAQIEDLLANYERHRAALRQYLDGCPPGRGSGMALADVYRHSGSAEPAARQRANALFAPFRAKVERGIGRIRQQLAQDTMERYRAFFHGKQSVPMQPVYAAEQFDAACRVGDLAALCHHGAAQGALDAVEADLPFLSGMVHGGSRVPLYSLLAGWEKRRGNELLYAVYQLRVARLSGRHEPARCEEIADILERQRLPEEANCVRLMARGDQQAIYDYLSARAAASYQTPPLAFEQRLDLRGGEPAGARVTLIVSVYNGADKADAFVAGLERFTAASKALTEVVFIDSHSPDATDTVLPARLRRAAERGLRSLYVRTPQRESIQTAWNRGIDLASGAYLAFLGLDEGLRPDALAILADYLDEHAEVDWVQGSAVVTEVDQDGRYQRDVMAYDRSFRMQEDHYLDCCYISYVGALYRKSIHQRHGYYDTQFRGAGDTEFKNRVLPSIKVASLPETLGVFLNYPEARTTQSPLVELEDLRAWYLFRTPGGMRYGLERRGPRVAAALFRRALHYQKSYMDKQCSDVELASVLADYLRLGFPAEYARIEQFSAGLDNLRLAYRRVDELVALGGSEGLEKVYGQAGALERVWYWIDAAQRSHQFFGLPAQYWINNDNRWHQHHTLWPSQARAD
jgi:glycosyltransferase involved in cell wall biosynthesis